MKKKIPFFHAFLVLGILTLALDCTCGWAASASKSALKPAVSGCHQHNQESKETSPEKCCGKCLIEKSAAMVDSDLSRLAAPAKNKLSDYVVQNSQNSVSPVHVIELNAFQFERLLYLSPGHPPAASRAPPVK